MKLTLLSLFLIVAFVAFNQKFTILEESPSTIDVKFQLSSKPFVYETLNGQNFLDFSKMYKNVILETGSPSLPVFGESFRLPLKGHSSIEIISTDFEDFTSVQVLPSKGNLKRNVDPSSVPFSFGEVYSKNEFYPANPFAMVDPFIARTVRGQVVRMLPYQYNPVSKTLRVYRSIRFKIVMNESVPGVNELALSQSNPSDVKGFNHLFANKSLDKYNVVEEEGEMLIITPDDYVSNVTPLSNWKNKKGIKTEIVSTNVAGTDATSIKTYIENYYQTHPGLKYLLLVGDHDKIPAYSYGFTSSEELYSDSYYGQLTGTDFYPEVFVGRLSGIAGEIDLMVNRIMEYETNPKSGDWMTKAIGLASGEGAGYGDDGQADWQHMREIRTNLLDYGYTHVYEFYEGSRGGEDASGNPASAPILEAVNNGVGLFNYTGHGDLNTCVTGNFGSSQVNQATNEGKYPFMISVACNNGTFMYGNCLAETWLKAKTATSPTGAIAVCASSILMAWAPPMQTQDEMTAINTESYSDNQKSTLGGLFYNAQMSMLEEYGVEGEEVMQTWVFFGDPSVDFRNKVTQELTVQHVAEINPNQDVTSAFTSVTEGATVAISFSNNYLVEGKISGSSSMITIPAQNPNLLLDVVATKQNYKPYFGQILVSATAGLNDLQTKAFMVYPNPTKDQLTIVNLTQTFGSVIEILDITGKVIGTFISDELTLSIPVNHLAKGSYHLVITVSGTKQVERFIKE
jgi:gingipain R